MIPVVCFVGRSESGKTTLLEQVIIELKSKRFRVGVLKHTPDGFDIDHKGKDSWRFAQADADIVAVASTDRIAFVERVEREPDLEQIREYFEGKVDILLVEGYKTSTAPKILVVRNNQDTEPPRCNGEILGTISSRRSQNGVPTFNSEVVGRVVSMILLRVMHRESQDSRGVSIAHA